MEDKDDVIISKIGHKVRLAMTAKESLINAMHEALDAAGDFSYELGAADAVDKALALLEAERNALQDLDMNEIYINGLNHGILLIKNAMK